MEKRKLPELQKIGIGVGIEVGKGLTATGAGCSAGLLCDDRGGKRDSLDRIVAMPTKIGQRGYSVHEIMEEYRMNQIDPDTDPDPDPEGTV